MSNDENQRPKSPIILPDFGSSEILPASSTEQKIRLSEAQLSQLGIKSEADLGDDFELQRSPIDNACVVVPLKDGMQVCWYCFMPFARGIPELEPAEIIIAKPGGQEQGLRAAVHAKCHLDWAAQKKGQAVRNG